MEYRRQTAVRCTLLAGGLFVLLHVPARAGEIRGRLLLGEKPASGITVSAEPYESPEAEARRRARRGEAPAALTSALTRGDGTFALAVPPVPGGAFRVLAEGGGAVASWVGGTYDASESDDLGEHALTRAEALSGRVVSAAGAPVAGASVIVVSREGLLGGDPDVTPAPHTVTTGPDGSFRSLDAAADGNRVTVAAKGYGAATLASVRAGTMTRPIALGLGALVSGVVLRSDGKAPAVGALVRFEAQGLETPWVESGADGRFELADLPSHAGTVVVEAGEAGLGEAATGPLPLPAGRTLSIRLAPPPTLQGRAVDLATRAPVPRARLTVEDGAHIRTTRSGPDGRYEVRGLLPQRPYRLRADDPRYAPYVRDRILLATAETLQADVPLRPGATLSGRVVDEGGRPIAGALGRLFAPPGAGLAGRVRAWRAGDRLVFRTAADGSFKATRLLPGDDQRLTVAHPDFEARTTTGLSLPAGATRTVTVTLRRGLTLVGRVRDEAGRPVPDAAVEVSAARGFGVRTGLPFAAGQGAAGPKGASGNDGRFEIKGLAVGDYAVTVSKEGFADHRLDRVPVDGDRHDPLDIRLSTGAAIQGTVTRRDGRGAEGYWVRAVPIDNSAPSFGPFGIGNLRSTGPDGTFSVSGLRAGETYDLVVLAPDGVGARREGVSAPSEGLEVVVPGPGRIGGRVVDAQTGAVVRDFQIDFGPDRSSGRRGFGANAGRAVARMMRQGTAAVAGGAQAIHSEDGTFVLDDVPPGTWEVVAQSKGYQTARVGGVTVDESGTREGVEVRLTAGNAIRGRVLDGSSGIPVLDASVTLQRPGGGGRALALLMGESDARTDADGLFAIEGLGAGSYTVVAQHPDFADATALVEVKEGPATTELRLMPGAAVAGTVLSETRAPLPGATVVLGAGAGFGRGGFLGGGLGSPAANSTITDDSGRFRFAHVTAGRYSVSASLRGHQTAPVDVLLQVGESKENLLLSLAQGARIHGTVSGLPAALRGNVAIAANGPDGWSGASQAGADGSFELAGAPAGPINLRAMAGQPGGSMRSATAQVALAEGQDDAQVQVVFEQGFTLTGTVSRHGQALDGAMVSASLAGVGGRTASARTDSSGAYRLEGLTEGTYSVMVTPPGGGRPQRESTALSDDATLDIVIPVARLGGTIVDGGTGQPLGEATVQAVEKDAGGPAARATTDSNGHFSLDDLDPSAYTLSVQRQGFLLQTRDVTAAEGAGDDLVLELTRGEGIGIEVRDAVAGVPLRGVQLRATSAAGAVVFGGNVALDSSGRGEVPSLPAGTYALAVYAPGYAPALVSAAAPAPRVLIAMMTGGGVDIHAGRATLAGGTARGQVLTAGGQPYPFSMFAPDGRLTLAAPLRRLENLGPGRYVLSLESGTTYPFEIQAGVVSVVTLP